MRECLNGCSGHGFCKLQLELPSLSGGGQGGSTGGSELVPLGHALQVSVWCVRVCVFCVCFCVCGV